MSLIYITGTAGTGKSTIKKELEALGYVAYGTDEDNIASWYDIRTGLKVTKPSLQQRNDDFLKYHIWLIDIDLLNALKQQSEASLIFLCGVASNDYDVHDIFDKRVCLTIDETSLVKRLVSRTDVHFGKTETELDNVLMWHEMIEDKNRSLGALMVNATQTIELVVEEIINYANK